MTSLGQGSVAQNNLGVAGQTPWPRDVPFPTEPLHVTPGSGFRRDAIVRSLALVRR